MWPAVACFGVGQPCHGTDEQTLERSQSPPTPSGTGGAPVIAGDKIGIPDFGNPPFS